LLPADYASLPTRICTVHKSHVMLEVRDFSLNCPQRAGLLTSTHPHEHTRIVTNQQLKCPTHGVVSDLPGRVLATIGASPAHGKYQYLGGLRESGCPRGKISPL